MRTVLERTYFFNCSAQRRGTNSWGNADDTDDNVDLPRDDGDKDMDDELMFEWSMQCRYPES